MKSLVTLDSCSKSLDYYLKVDKAFVSGAYTIFICDAFDAIFIFILILLTIFKHKVYGFNLWLLISLEIGIIGWIIAYAFEFSGIQHLYNSVSQF